METYDSTPQILKLVIPTFNANEAILDILRNVHKRFRREGTIARFWNLINQPMCKLLFWENHFRGTHYQSVMKKASKTFSCISSECANQEALIPQEHNCGQFNMQCFIQVIISGSLHNLMKERMALQLAFSVNWIKCIYVYINFTIVQIS